MVPFCLQATENKLYLAYLISNIWLLSSGISSRVNYYPSLNTRFTNNQFSGLKQQREKGTIYGGIESMGNIACYCYNWKELKSPKTFQWCY